MLNTVILHALPRTILPAFLFAGVVALGGCVAERGGECPPAGRSGHRLTFSYTYNNSEQDMIASSVRTIRIYVFEQPSGVLCDVVEAGRREIERGWVELDPMADGTYTFVAWGGSSDDLGRSYSARRMVDRELHIHSAIAEGVTTLDELSVMLDHEAGDVVLADGDDAAGGRLLVPATPDFDDLFHAVAAGVKLRGGVDATVPFDFVRNTSVLKVSVTGLEHLSHPGSTRGSGAAIEIFATGGNGRYAWDNSIDRWAPRVFYGATNHHLTDTSMALDIKMMRLHSERHADDPVLLHVEDGTGRDIVEPVDIVAGIARVMDSDGRPRYPDQEAIDREDEFRVNIAFTPDRPGVPDNQTRVMVTVTINGWEIVDVGPVLNRP